MNLLAAACWLLSASASAAVTPSSRPAQGVRVAPAETSATRPQPPTKKARSPKAKGRTDRQHETAIKLAFTAARLALPKLIEWMEARAVKARVEQQRDVAGVLSLLPLLALLAVPFWIWRRRRWQQARAKGLSPKATAVRSTLATLCVTGLLFGSVQVFLGMESVKNQFAWASPAQALAGNTLSYIVDEGPNLIGENARLVLPTIRALALGKVDPLQLLPNLLANAEAVQNNWVFSFGYRLYQRAFPILEHSWSLLLVVMLLFFLRFSLPAVREILGHLSGDGTTSFGRLLLRNLRVEILATLLFLLPYLLLTILSIFVTFWVTDTAARGILENLLKTLNILLAQPVSPGLVIVNFLSIVAFIFEVVVLLVLVSGLLFGIWMQVLHDKFRSRRRFREYRRFPKHLLRVIWRLYGPVLALALGLSLALELLSGLRAKLGPTLTLVVPAGLLIVFNFGLWILRFFRAVRMSLDTSPWQPEGASSEVQNTRAEAPEKPAAAA